MYVFNRKSAKNYLELSFKRSPVRKFDDVKNQEVLTLNSLSRTALPFDAKLLLIAQYSPHVTHTIGTPSDGRC